MFSIAYSGTDGARIFPCQRLSEISHVSNRDTPELRIFWIFPANPGVQTFTVKILWYCTVTNDKYIIHVGHSIVNNSAPWSYNSKCFFVPPDKLGKTHICRVPDSDLLLSFLRLNNVNLLV